MAANFALPETKFARFRLGTEIITRSKPPWMRCLLVLKRGFV